MWNGVVWSRNAIPAPAHIRQVGDYRLLHTPEIRVEVPVLPGPQVHDGVEIVLSQSYSGCCQNVLGGFPWLVDEALGEL